MDTGSSAGSGCGQSKTARPAPSSVVGLHYPEGWSDREVAWAIAKAFWGQGLAYEAARAALEHAFGALQWPRAVSLIDPANQRSIRLAARLGERFERETAVRGHRVRLYAIERDAWHAASQ